MHENVLDILRAGDRYRAPYASAFHCDGHALLKQIAAPTLLCAGARDPLATHLDRLAPTPHFEIRRHGPERASGWENMAQWLAARAKSAAPDWPPPGVDDLGVTRGVLGNLRAWELGVERGRPLVLVHAPGSSLEAEAARASREGASRRVLLLERPLHGESGDGDMRTELARSTWCDAEIVYEPGPAPPTLNPHWDGAHLTTAWRYAWRCALFEPWDVAEAQHARTGAPDVDAVHAHAVDLLKSWRAFAPSVF
jgi:hypothetical protein